MPYVCIELASVVDTGTCHQELHLTPFTPVLGKRDGIEPPLGIFRLAGHSELRSGDIIAK